MKTCLIFLVAIFLPSKSIIPQSTALKSFHPYSNTLGITLELGGTIPNTDYKLNELDISGRFMTEYFFTSRSIHAFGIRLFAGGGFINGEVFSNEPVFPPVSEKYRTGLFFTGIGFTYAVKLGYSVPYVSTSISYLIFDPGDSQGNQLPGNSLSLYKKETVLYSGELGIKFPFSKMWSLNLGLNFNFAATDYLDDIRAGSNNDAFLNFFTGFSIVLGGSNDIDNDGVEDNLDACLDTPEGELVDEFGCSLNDIIPKGYIYNNLKDQFISDRIFTDGTTYCFQVNTFNDSTNSAALKNKISTWGYKAEIFKMVINNSVWYSVRIGYFTSYKQALEKKKNFFRETKLKLKY